MGRKINSGLSIGVHGQLSFENFELVNKLNGQKQANYPKLQTLVTEEDIMKLQNAGVKFNKEDVIFVTNDSSGKLIWLEKGNDQSGLNHIKARHSNDFAKKHGVSVDKIQSHIKNIIEHGKLEYEKVTQRNGRDCYERLYSKSGKYYLQMGVGFNGYLVSAYPISKKEALALIRRNKK